MKLYKYRARNKLGEKVQCIEEAEGFEYLCRIVASRHQVITDYQRLCPCFYKVRDIEKVAFLKHIKFQYLNSVSLVKSIENFIKISDNLFFVFQLRKVLDALKRGDTLQAAFNDILDGVLAGFLASLETTGNLVMVLDAMIEYIETKAIAGRRLRKHLQYPLFILLFITVVVFGFAKFLLPSIEEISGKGSCLEGLYLFYLVFVLIIAGFSICCFFSDEFLVKNPLTSSLVIRLNNWYFAVTLYINLKAKLLCLQAFKNSIMSISNSFIRQEFVDIFNRLNNGLSMQDAVKDKISMSKRLKEFITIGEVNNSFLLMLNSYNQFEKDAILSKVRSIGGTLSVSIMLLAGLLLICILVGVFFPMYQTLFGLDSLNVI